MKSKYKRSLVLSLLAGIAMGACAEEYFQTATMSGGTSWNSALWATTGGVAEVPTNGNTYINNTIDWQTRTGNAGTFAGDSLELRASGTRLGLRTPAVHVNLIMNAGSEINNISGGTKTLAGTITSTNNNGTGEIEFIAGADGRNITVDSWIELGEEITNVVVVVGATTSFSAATLSVNNPTNTYAGTWDVQNGTLKGAGLGSASFKIGATSALDFDADFVSSHSFLNVATGGAVILDQNVLIDTATIWGLPVGAGTYTGAELKSNADYGDAFSGASDTNTLTVLTGVALEGETVYQTANMGSGIDWDHLAYWDNGEAPSGENEYINDNPTNAVPGWLTRSPETGSGAFNGKSLTITNGASLSLKSNGPWTVNKLYVWDGCSIGNSGAGNGELNGKLYLKGSGSVTLDAATTSRNIAITSEISADSAISNIVITLSASSPTNTAHAMGGGFSIAPADGNENTFAGLWTVESGALKGTDFGDADFLVTDFGYLDFDASYFNLDADLTIEAHESDPAKGGMILLDQNVAFGSVSIWGIELADGTYTAAELLNDPDFGAAIDPDSLSSATMIVGNTDITITQTGSHGTQQSWETAALWSNGESASGLYHYLNNTAGWKTRSPQSANPIFPGKSLTMSNGSTITMKHSGTMTVSNLIMYAGTSIGNGNGGERHIAGDSLKVMGEGSFTLDSGTSGRTCDISSLIEVESGVSNMTILVGSTYTPDARTTTGYSISNPSNTFAGVWDIQEGFLKGVGFGTADFLVGQDGYLDCDYNYNNTEASLTIVGETNTMTGGIILLDTDIWIGSATIWGEELPVGTYTGADLKAHPLYGSAFDTNSLDSATLTVNNVNDIVIETGVSGSNFIMGWNGTASATYTVLKKHDLVYDDWAEVAVLPGTNGVMTYPMPTTNSEAFFMIEGH